MYFGGHKQIVTQDLAPSFTVFGLLCVRNDQDYDLPLHTKLERVAYYPALLLISGHKLI